MTDMPQQDNKEKANAKGGDRVLLAIVLAIQSLAAVFFVGDAAADLAFEALAVDDLFEALIAVALVLGVAVGAREMRRAMARARRTEAALSAAQGALADVVANHFEDWRLTPAETEVAMLALKGFDVAGIAELRGAATGTVRAQLTRVYKKAGVSNRAELLSLFIDELLEGLPVSPLAKSGE